MKDPPRTDRDATAPARGRAAEQAAAEALERAGCTVVERNARVPGAEIDLVCRDADGFVFVEVRGRGLTGTDPSDTIGSSKLRRMRAGAARWLAAAGAPGAPHRLLVVAVRLADDGRPLAVDVIDDPFMHAREFHEP